MSLETYDYGNYTGECTPFLPKPFEATPDTIIYTSEINERTAIEFIAYDEVLSLSTKRSSRFFEEPFLKNTALDTCGNIP